MVGAGYIAVEMAGILKALGSDVTQMIRQDKVLRSFDQLISTKVTEELEASGIQVLKKTQVAEVRADPETKKKTVVTDGGVTIDDVDCVLWAIGRVPNTQELGLARASVDCTPRGHVVVDQWQNTSNPNVFALGDVTGKWELTPGKKLHWRLSTFFKGKGT